MQGKVPEENIWYYWPSEDDEADISEEEDSGSDNTSDSDSHST